MSRRIQTLITGLVLLVALVWGLGLVWKWGFTRVFVPHDKALVVINRYGQTLPADRVVIEPGEEDVFQGIQKEVRGPGRYFLNPIIYDTELVDLVEIPAGDPQKWAWTPEGLLADPSIVPQMGLVTAKQGRTPPPGEEVVEEGFKGIQKTALTPGTYKVNPYLYEVKLTPAVVVPPGSVGVVTRLFGDRGDVISATLTEIREQSAATTVPATQPADAGIPTVQRAPSRLVVGPNQRGILGDVLQPGIYYLNPRLYKVNVVPVGYDAIALEHPGSQIRFYSYDGYLVEADFTVVWGRAPADAPHIVANIGGIERIQGNVLEPAMKAACQNEGAKYTAKELIQGASRSKFQDDLAASLERQVASRNIHVLLALIRNITIKDTTGKDQTDGLLATIQRANIEIERELTNRQKTLTAATRARLEEALKAVDVARETVASDTTVKVANIAAEATKKAAEIDAQREVDVATIALEAARLEAERSQILGRAKAEVERLRNDAEAQGAKLMVDAFGSPEAYNLYVFARNFAPQDLRMIFAGPGTFWTDLKSFEQIGATQIVRAEQERSAAAAAPVAATQPALVPALDRPRSR